MADVTVVVTTGNPISVNLGQVTPQYTQKETYGREKFTATEGQTDFDLAVVFRANSCHVYLNGILQEVDVDYTEENFNQRIAFASGLTAGDKVEVQYVKE